nr:MAG TPA: Pregnane X receptor receptor, hormone receptor, pregnane [Caudoviricetes sp.]
MIEQDIDLVWLADTLEEHDKPHNIGSTRAKTGTAPHGLPATTPQQKEIIKW